MKNGRNQKISGDMFKKVSFKNIVIMLIYYLVLFIANTCAKYWSY